MPLQAMRLCQVLRDDKIEQKRSLSDVSWADTLYGSLLFERVGSCPKTSHNTDDDVATWTLSYTTCQSAILNCAFDLRPTVLVSYTNSSQLVGKQP